MPQPRHRRAAPTPDHRRTATDLAVAILAAGIRAELFANNPMGGSDEARMRWMHDALAPLAPVSPAVRAALRVLDPDRVLRGHDYPSLLRRRLRRLLAEVRRVARAGQRVSAGRSR